MSMSLIFQSHSRFLIKAPGTMPAFLRQAARTRWRPDHGPCLRDALICRPQRVHTSVHTLRTRLGWGNARTILGTIFTVAGTVALVVPPAADIYSFSAAPTSSRPPLRVLCKLRLGRQLFLPPTVNRAVNHTSDHTVCFLMASFLRSTARFTGI